MNTDTGLPTRSFVLQQLADSLQRQSRGGLFFVEVNSALSLRERYGYAVFEHLMNQAGRQLASAASPHPVARLNDNSFLMLADSVDEATLAALAQQLRDGLAGHDFQTRPNEVLKLRGSVGYTALSLGFADAG